MSEDTIPTPESTSETVAAPAEATAPAPTEGGPEEAPQEPEETAQEPERPQDADLARKEALLAEAREVSEGGDWRQGASDLRRILEQWRAIPYRHTDREDELWAQLQAARTAFFDARDEAHKRSAQRKAELVEEARRLSESTDWRAAGERANSLMDEWKAAGSAGHEEDERLWAQFRGYRRDFFERRGEHYRELERERAHNREQKEALIAEAREVVQVSQDWGAREWKAANARMRDLMGRWRGIGRARREDNDRLWEEFNGLRQQFFDAQHAHHEELERSYAANAAAKQELIDTATRIADEGDYSRESADAMRELDVRWKAIGYAGREANDALWERFRDAKEGFWEARRERNEERHRAWVEKSEAAAERRRGQVENLRDQISRIQLRIDRATVTTSESQLREMQGWIDEKRERIGQLEAEIADIEAKLGA